MLDRPPGRRSARRWLLAPASAAALAGAAVQPSLEGVSADVAGGRVTIGAIWPGASLIGAALAQANGSVTLENVTFESSSATYRLPRVEFVGASLSRDHLARLLDPKAAEPWPARLARLSAERIVIPSITVEQTVGPQLQTATYRNVVVVGVREGRVATMASDGCDILISGGPQGDFSGTVGRLAIGDLDLSALIALYTDRASEQPGPLKRIYGGFSMENLSFNGTGGFVMKVAKASGRDFLARRTREGWNGFAGGLSPEGLKTPADKLRQLSLLADLYEAFDAGSAEVLGVELRDAKSGDDVAITLDRIAYASSSTGQPSDLRMERMAFSGRNGGGRIGLVAFTGFSLAATADGARTLAAKPGDQIGPHDLRALIPTVGTVRIADLDVEAAPSVEGAAPGPDRVRFGVRLIALTAGSQDASLQRLAGMGYRTLDLSFASAANWTESSNELQIRELSLRGAEMGGVTLRGTVGDVTKDAFASDSAVAWLGATARSLEFTVEDKGLAERLLAQEARRQKTSPEDLRRAYGAAAAIGMPALLGNSSQAKAVAQAVARFLAKPGRLVITAKAKDAAGLGAADVAALGDVASVLDKIDITARAD
jgi:hypothetical protein